MKCSSCGAETRGKYCEYCGSEIQQEKAVNITNNYYGHPENNGQNNASNNRGICPKCGHSKVTFKRERIGTATKSRSNKSFFGTGRNGHSVSQTAYTTVGVCQNCGYSWYPNANEANSNKGNNIWLWILGWLFIFPIPLTIIMLKKKNLKPAIKYGIIAAAWILFFIIGLTGNSDSEIADVEPNIKAMSFSTTNDVVVKVGEKSSSSYLQVDVRSRSDFSPENVTFVSSNPEVANIVFTKEALTTYLYYEIIGIGAGETEVYAIANDGTTESEHIKVIVPKPIVIETITLTPNKTELSLGDKVTTDVSISPENADDKSIAWHSTDESVAVVEENGTIIAVGDGNAIITASSTNGVNSSFEVKVDGSKRTMNVSVSYPRQDDYNIGDAWNHSIRLNGESIPRSISVGIGDTLKFYARFSEEDDNPDIGENSSTHTVTKEDFENGFTVPMNVYVTENGGKNSGQSAHFIVTYKFIP